MSVQVQSSVAIYETDGEESTGLTFPKVIVESHWNRSEMVVLKVGRRKYTVLGRDLEAAIRNAMNTSR